VPAPAAANYGEKPNGNTVSLEEQMMKQADVANNYALAAAAYSKSLSLMKTAIDFGK
jgi:flagellar basal-body rod protein FlgB